MIEQWHCDFSDPELITSGVTVAVQYTKQDCFVTASSSDPLPQSPLPVILVSTSTGTSTPQIGYYDWLYVSVIVIFLLAIMALRSIFTPLRK